MKFRNGVFIITEEVRCPLYNEGEEFTIDGLALVFPAAKPTCLVLTQDVLRISSEEISYEKFERGARKRSRFQCGGCSGIISFDFKKEKEFATLQMKLLMAAERREKLKEIAQYAGLLKSITLFKSLSENDLFDLAALLRFQDYDYGFPI
ncbi:MAG: Crp/Fnr family transcriptional regulator, partial [Bacteroidetes bacterium]|nr:Crp/Fnr family transcriptional regulator [Bacteroidota bacterium]